MKTLKKLAATLLAVMLLATTLIIPASAAGYTVYIETGKSTHTYEVYQIFTGDLNEQGVLTHIQWGSGVSAAGETALGSAESQAGGLKTPADADAFGRALADYLQDPIVTVEPEDYKAAMANGKAGYEITGLEAGYYLIKDQDDSLADGADDAYTKYMIQVVGNVSVAPKSGVPTLTKRVSRSISSGFANGVSAALHTPLYFELKASLHDQISSYDTYTLTFEDTLASGLTYTKVLGVYIINRNAPGEYNEVPAEKYTVNPDEINANGGGTVTITMDAKDAVQAATGEPAAADDQVVVCIQAELNDTADMGRPGNANTAVLQYSNDPYDTTSYGETAAATAMVYAYELQLKKVDAVQNDKELAGAQFVLYHYKDAVGTMEYVVVDENGNFVKAVPTQAEATVLTTDENGRLSVSGLPFGTHYFKEVAPPSGYNMRSEDVSVTINQTINETTGELTAFSATATGDIGEPVANIDDGSVLVTVGNRAGAVLPSTGGMGTTLFYIVGSILMVGAAAVLLAKKRYTQC